MSLAKECYSMKLDLLTNATVVDDAIRFASSNKSKEKQKWSVDNNNEDDDKKEESIESDYEEPGEINHKSMTTNEVF
ncbi:MAG: hypothetical protein ACJ71H_00035 [Nitrososphaeraceae archaeon]